MTRASAWVEAQCRGHGADPDFGAVLAMVTEEVLSNVVKYGGDRPTIEVDVARVGDAIEVVVIDDGVPFDPTTVPIPNLGEDGALRAVGGLGLVIVRAMTDEFAYERRDDRNRVTLRKRLRRGA